MSKSKKKKKSGIKSGISTIVVTILFLAVIAGIVKVGIPLFKMYHEATQIVKDSDDKTFKASQTSIVYDINGDEIKKLKGEKDVYYLKYDDISDAAKLAIISVEDKNFTRHRGVDMVGMARSVLSLIIHRGHITMGGSTITQQLARNFFLTFEQTYSRKLKEVFIASELERKYSKETILEFYLNNVYFANGYYGIEAASQGYFRKSCKDLSISQTAFLCSIPNAPNRYNPYDHPDSTLKRRDKILTKMYEEGYIDKPQYERSLVEEIRVMPKKEVSSNDYAETYILKCATEALMEAQGFHLQTHFSSKEEKEEYKEKYDEVYTACKQSLYTAGYRIYTSIDMEMQKKLQEQVSRQLSGTFTEKTDDGVFRVQGAAVCIDNATGHVNAIVGGREEDQEGYGLNRAYQIYRQPGSAIKPLVVYAPALEKGYTPDSTVDDTPMTGEDRVKNAGDSYSGYISLRTAVEKSSNVATYRLYQELGQRQCLEYLEDLNFAGLDEKDYKYDTTCIGGFTNGTTPVEMAAGYAAIANDGTYRKPTCIEKITDAQGEDVVESDGKAKSIYTVEAARAMTNVLESVVTSYNGTANNCKLDIDIPVACKTGTTSSYVDGWLCGYSPYYTTAVWVGMDVYASVDDLKGNTYPAYIWKAFMDEIHRNIERDLTLEGMFGLYGDMEYDEPTTEEKKEESFEEEEEEEKEEEHDQDEYLPPEDLYQEEEIPDMEYEEPDPENHEDPQPEDHNGEEGAHESNENVETYHIGD
ncbi:MAG: transglycosylase domain-containing protein [Eubacteriales bacterium]|nr:transglycosylase domain-containing protein [Eubacteriales bacterium]